MHTILEKRQLSQDVFYFRVKAPEIARNRKAGQFIIFQLDENFGERVPLTIADANAEEGWIALVAQAVGATTYKLSKLNVGDEIAAILGPLGSPTHIEKVGTVVCVGGGIGVAPMHPIAQAYKKAGKQGHRHHRSPYQRTGHLRGRDARHRRRARRRHGRRLLRPQGPRHRSAQGVLRKPQPPNEVIAIGPPIMMKFCAETTRPFGIHTMVSLNTIMIDGTGMCGGCRVTVGGETKFVCVDGPEFDGHKVDFDNMMMRMKAFRDREQEDNHKCRMELEKAGA